MSALRVSPQNIEDGDGGSDKSFTLVYSGTDSASYLCGNHAARSTLKRVASVGGTKSWKTTQKERESGNLMAKSEQLIDADLGRIVSNHWMLEVLADAKLPIPEHQEGRAATALFASQYNSGGNRVRVRWRRCAAQRAATTAHAPAARAATTRMPRRSPCRSSSYRASRRLLNDITQLCFKARLLSEAGAGPELKSVSSYVATLQNIPEW